MNRSLLRTCLALWFGAVAVAPPALAAGIAGASPAHAIAARARALGRDGGGFDARRATPHVAIATSGDPANTTTADPPVPRPRTRPCEVPLFTGLTFSDFTPKPFQFAPPARCRAPWAKVVFVADLGVTAGRQFDRTATVGLGGATIYFGTTAEPSRTVARSWHVERDLTDLSALFRAPQTGQISIGNVVDATYTGVLDASAKLQFYPAGDDARPPVVADVVVPLADPGGNPVALQTASDTLARAFTTPRTVERAYLEVIAQSQIGDEFWYTCFPNDLATRLNNCGNTAFRETEIALDGRPAGVAPIYPWIYTGGIDPYLWRPIPGVETLDFVPYRVDLTPFAGTLDDGASHTVALAVFNANHYFSATANLLLFLDHRAKRPLGGGVDADTLVAAPPERVIEGGSFDASGFGSGTIDTTSRRDYTIAGHVDTSHGRVRTEIRAEVDFAQHQAVTNSATAFAQTIAQRESILTDVRSSGDDRDRRERTRVAWPLALAYAFAVNPDGTSAQTTSVRQGDERHVAVRGADDDGFASALSNVVTAQDTLVFDATGAFVGPTADASRQTYRSRTSRGACYGRTVRSVAGLVTEDRAVGCDDERDDSERVR